jgi:hypothetical protein
VKRKEVAMNLYNVYCDESCHLEHDGIDTMALGAIWCPNEKVREINERIRQIKKRNGVAGHIELKWTKISASKHQLYADVVNYFFDEASLHARILIIPDKKVLDHARFSQTHDTWYYKMYFEMLKVFISPTDFYEIYIDIKDTHSNQKTKKLKEVINNSMYDFSSHVIKRLQPIQSDEVQILQIIDILIGALTFSNRDWPKEEHRNDAKEAIVQQIRNRAGYSLKKSTLLREDKFNLFFWEAR